MNSRDIAYISYQLITVIHHDALFTLGDIAAQIGRLSRKEVPVAVPLASKPDNAHGKSSLTYNGYDVMLNGVDEATVKKMMDSEETTALVLQINDYTFDASRLVNGRVTLEGPAHEISGYLSAYFESDIP